MTKAHYLFAALMLALTGCDTLTKQRLAGTYQYTGKKDSFHVLNKFELTGTKFVADVFMGERAFDYEVQDGYLYMYSAGNQYRFQIVNPDTLRSEGNSGMSGTYVRVK